MSTSSSLDQFELKPGLRGGARNDSPDEMDLTMLLGQPGGREASESPLRTATVPIPDVSPSEFSEATVNDMAAVAARRHPPKAPWDPFLKKRGDLEGNSEQCGCGSVFIGADTFCYRCGCRRPVDVTPLPMHVGRMPEPPIDDVGERMIAWAEAYRQRREALTALKKENQDSADKLLHAGTPHINPLSHELASDMMPISERYKGLVRMKELQISRKRDEIGKEKAEAYKLTPRINAKSSNLERGVEDLLKFRRKRDQKVENRKHQKFQELMEECTFQPILGACNRRFAIAHQHKVHDRLYTDANQRRWTLKADQDHSEAEWKSTNSRKARTRSPKSQPPKVKYTPPQKVKNKLAPQLARSKSQDPSTSKVRFGSSSPAPTKPPEDDSPKIPNFRRGPRASAGVLPTKEELTMSRKKSARRRRNAPRGSSGSKRGSEVGGRLSRASSRASSICSSDDGRRGQSKSFKSVWTGGQNVVTVTNQFKTLLERCQAGLEDDSRPTSPQGRGNRRKSISSRSSR
jgi:hypothetical protein